MLKALGVSEDTSDTQTSENESTDDSEYETEGSSQENTIDSSQFDPARIVSIAQKSLFNYFEMVHHLPNLPFEIILENVKLYTSVSKENIDHLQLS